MANLDGLDAANLFEDVDGELQLSKYGLELMASIDARLDEQLRDRITFVAEKVEQYIDKEVAPWIKESVASSEDELRKLMLLAVSELGGPEAATSFIRKVGTLARSGALSAASGDWASGASSKSASNKQSITPGFRPSNEDLDLEEADVVLEVFDEVTEGMSEDQVAQMRSLCEDIEFEGDVPELRERISTVREVAFPGANPYVAAISRTVRRG